MAIAALLIFMGGSLAFAQNKVSGTVTDENGEPIVAASVVVRGTTIGVVTDLDGNYSISVPANSTLVASCIGYSDQVVNYTNQGTVNFVLKEDALFLDETVVIGYQTVKRRDLTGSVASVNSKQLTSAPVANVAQAIQGKLPGVNIVSQDGRPDASMNIRVRGGGSISQSNDPLILIDGVAGTMSDIPSDQIEDITVLKDASSTAIYGARGANGVILITTKGAKEGKFRVTYNGYAKLNTPTKYLEALGPYDYLYYVWANAEAHDHTYGAAPFTKLYGLGEYGDINRYKNVQKYDIQRQVYGPSFSHNHDLSISGGTENTKVLLSLGWNKEDGMKLNSWTKRGNIALKVDQKIGNRVNVGVDLRYTDYTAFGVEGTGSRSGSVLSSSYRYRPIATSDILGNLDAFQEGAIEQYGKGVLWDVYDPVRQIMDNEPLRQRQALRGTLSLNWNIVKGLTYHTDLSGGRAYNQNKTWTGAVVNNYLNDKTGEKQHAGNATVYQANSWTIRWTNTLNYEFEVGKAHRFNILLGHEMSNTGGDSMTITADHFPANFTKENAFYMIDQFDANASTVARKFYTGYNTPSRILSFFGRINYSLLDRYLFTVTMRADGSSKFAPSHRWGYFPAAAFAWRISEEPFMEEANWLNDLKLRLSYGTVGNDGISSDLWSQSWEAATGNNYYSIANVKQSAYTISSAMANPDLKWETTVTRNLGIDFGVLNGRLSGTIDLYWNSTKDLLMNMTLPRDTGFSTTYANIGQTSNKGIEVSLNAILVQTRDWGLTLGGNINFNKNNIDQLSDSVTPLYGSSWFHSGNPGNDFGLFVGQPVGLVRGLVYDGLYQVSDFDYDPATQIYTLKPGVPDVSANITGPMYGIQSNVPKGQNAYPGMPKFIDQPDENGKTDGIVDVADYRVIGNTNPLFTGGLNLTANYRNWDFGAYFNFSVGNKIYNITKLATLNGYKESGVFENHLAFMKDSFKIYDIQGGQLVRVHEPAALQALNANATYPLSTNENGIVSTLGIEDGSYLRLNTLTVGYSLPNNSKFAKALCLSSLRVYATIYNLFTITKYSGLDPEVSTAQNMNGAAYPTPGVDWGAYPRARSFVLGVNLSF
ncbi:MAG: TonB-dependent receptor [Bacteroidales bacterium]|nr:TonB-dependent receptor [Bacteroidales bacterium]